MRYIIIGTGNISNTYVAAIHNVDGAELVDCVSRSAKRPQSAPNIECKPSIAEMEADFDAVIITTPNGLHHVSAIEAANLGKHVLTEKPLDITLAAMDDMIQACDQAGVTLGVAFQRRANPDNLTLKKMFASQAFGRIYAADLACKFWRDQAYYDSGDYRGGLAIDGGGPFIQQACHNIDLYIWFFGMPDKVESMLGRFAHKIEAEDHGAALLKYDNGMIGTIIASTVAKPGFPARLEVHCEKGSFITIDDCITTWEIEGIPNPAAKNDSYQHDSAKSAAVTDTSRHEAIIRDFEAAVREKRLPLADAPSARQTTELILKIYGRT